MKQIVLLLMLLFTYGQAEYLENAQVPKEAKSDWMELQSGEWIRGSFKGMYSGKMEFDSEEFGLVKFDVSDVKQLITQGKSTVSLNKKMPNLRQLKNLKSVSSLKQDKEVTGKLSFENGRFTITLNDGRTKSIPSNSISSVFAGEAKESNYWSANVFVGVDILSGNTQQVTITGKASAERRTSLTRFRTDYLSTYTKIDNDTTTTDNNRLTGTFDLYQTNHFYWRLASLEAIRDPFKNIRSKYTVGVGVGDDILYTNTIDWSVTMGSGYQHTTFDTVVSGEDATADTPLIFLDTRYKQSITTDVDFLLNYNMYIVNTASGSYVHHMEVSLETELISDLSVDLSLFWDRVEAPTTFDDGTRPGKNDFKTMLAIGYSY
ncbi:DUF481 domain-containing protein [Sulfurimonas sp.]|uniref:DUF481 domain-containing protein n=1 Tax=Sulfurimonas sp. TaxID=2022749 RepID=UPI00261F7D09|nr:DUF481 domain-containing protein [Sulfurimonas sp.]